MYPVKTTLSGWDETGITKNLKEFDLIVNCTSIGMKSNRGMMTPLETKDIPKGSLVFDVVYNPAETRLIQEAKKAGARTLGGLSMLVYQGAEAFHLWTGRPPPLEIMFRAAREALEKL